MKNFPVEYLYIDNNGNTFYKKYKTKKIICQIDSYNIGSIPVIFNKNLTLANLMKVVKNNEILQKIGVYSKDFIQQLENKDKVDLIEGELYFYWDDLQMTNNIPETIYPKMEVCLIINDNNEKHNIHDFTLNQLQNVKIRLDDNFRILNKEYKVIETTLAKPTLLQIIYGLFWECSFYGKDFKRES